MNTNNPSRQNTIIGAVIVAWLPHLSWLPAETIILSGTICLYAWGSAKQWLPLPGPKTKAVLGLGLLAGLLYHFGGVDRQAAISLFCVMLSLKTLELATRRDQMISLLLTYLFTVTTFLFPASLLTAFGCLLSLWVTSAALLRVNARQMAAGRRWLAITQMSSMAIPVVVLLFVVFPRYEGRLWSFHRTPQAVTGLNDRLAPGNIAALTKSYRTAFKVSFAAQAPPLDQMYWRSLVFWHFDGRNWEMGLNFPPGRYHLDGSESIEYEITLEPHGHKWLTALDMPLSASPRVQLLSDHTLALKHRVRNPYHYTATSYLTYHTGSIGPWPQRGLELPATGNQRARQLAQSWRSAATTPQAIVAMALNYFQQNGFSYSLTPPLLGRHSVDEFLFETRTGYCEHFASAFAFLMRAAGVHSRLVGGYLGGEYNEYGDYWTVRNADAHVWVEIWSTRSGWIRIDPTLTIAPERLTSDPSSLSSTAASRNWFDIQWPRALQPHVKRWRQSLEALNTVWLRNVLGYSSQSQQALWSAIRKWLPNFSKQSLVTGISAVTATILMYLVLRRYRIRRLAPQDTISRTYDRFCGKMARIGLARHPATGPRDYARQIAHRRMDLKPTVDRIIDLYIRLRYAERICTGDAHRFKRLVRSFKLR
jgi:hypothetical protein